MRTYWKCVLHIINLFYFELHMLHGTSGFHSKPGSRTQVPCLSRVSGKMNHLISLLFNFTVTTLGLKSQKNINILKYTHAHTQPHPQKQFRMANAPWTMNYSWARMTHRRFICFKCLLQQRIQSLAKSDQLLSCSLIGSALFLEGVQELHWLCTHPVTGHGSV